MTRKTMFVGIIVAGVIAGGAAPALAQPDGHLCVAATHDREHPGPGVVCVWTPDSP
jgi:hypothetical protein